MAYNYELDKITYQELSISLQNTIKANKAHRENDDIHVTLEDKAAWNTVKNLPLVTATTKGYMSPEDKVKLDTVETGANNYVHPKSGVRPGVYFQVEVNDEGHVILGRNPSKLNTTADNADRLGNIPASAYAKLVAPNFLGEATTETPNGKNLIQIANVEYVNKRRPYIKQDETPGEVDFPRFWIGPNNCLNAHDDVKNWNSVYSEASLSVKALNLETNRPTKPNDYSGFLKFAGLREVAKLGLTRIHSTSTKLATVFGMRGDSTEVAYEFILIDDFIYVRSGKDRTWGLEKPLFGGDTRPDNAVTYNESGHIVAGDIEMWIGEE